MQLACELEIMDENLVMDQQGAVDMPEHDMGVTEFEFGSSTGVNALNDYNSLQSGSIVKTPEVKVADDKYLSNEAIKAAETASLDYAAGKNHVNFEPTIEQDFSKSGSQYLTGDGGMQRGEELLAMCGVQEGEWRNYVKNGGYVPAGYEMESKLLYAAEGRNELYSQYESGVLSYSDFLYRAYGKDLMALDGHNVESVSYWYDRLKQGYTESITSNAVYMEDLLSRAESQFQQDEYMQGLFRSKETFANLSNGEELTEDTFANYFGAQFTDEYLDALGGYAGVMDKYKAGMLNINPFIDANGDGKISDGDFMFHDDGKIYKLGVGATIKQRDEDGNPIEVVVGDTKNAVAKGFGKFVWGVFNGFVGGIADTVITLGALIADGFANIGDSDHGTKFTTEYITKKDAWENSWLNDDVWTADGAKSTQEQAMQAVDAVGNITGMILMTVATMGIGTAASGAQLLASGADDVAVQGAKQLAKTGVKLTKKGLANYLKNSTDDVIAQSLQQYVGKAGLKAASKLGTKNVIKYLGAGAIKTAATGLGSFTQFSNGVVKGTLPHSLSIGARAWASSAASAAVLTARDFVDNVGRSFALNDAIPDVESRRSAGQIIGDAAAMAAINWAISTTLRATWDDVGITGRIGSVADDVVTRTGAQSSAAARSIAKLYASPSKLAALADTLADSAEMVFTNVNNQYVLSGGFSALGAEEYGNIMKNYLSSPAGLISLTYSSVATYRGSMGGTGVVHRPYQQLAQSATEVDRSLDNSLGSMKQDLLDKRSKAATADDVKKANEDMTAFNLAVQDYAKGKTDFSYIYNDDGTKKFGVAFDKDGFMTTTYDDESKAKPGVVSFEKKTRARDNDGKYQETVEHIYYTGNEETRNALKAEGVSDAAIRDITSLPASFHIMVNAHRFAQKYNAKSQLTKAFNDTINKLSVNNRLRRSSQVAQRLAFYAHTQNQLGNVAIEGPQKLLDKIKETAKDKVKNIFEAMTGKGSPFRGKKWASVIGENVDLDVNKEYWLDIIEHPERMFRSKFAFGNVYNSNLDDITAAERKFLDTESFTETYTKLAEMMSYAGTKNEDIKRKCKELGLDREQVSKFLRALNEAKRIYGENGITDLQVCLIKDGEALGTDWNSDGVQKERNRIQAIFKSLHDMTADPDDPQANSNRDFVVVKSRLQNKKDEYFVIFRPGDEIQTLQGETRFHESFAALYSLSKVSDPRDIIKCIDGVISTIVTFNHDSLDEEIKNVGRISMIDTLLKNEGISIASAVKAYKIIPGEKNIKGRDKLTNVVETYDAYLEVKKTFDSLSDAYQKKATNEDAYTKALNDFRDKFKKLENMVIGDSNIKLEDSPFFGPGGFCKPELMALFKQAVDGTPDFRLSQLINKLDPDTVGLLLGSGDGASKISPKDFVKLIFNVTGVEELQEEINKTIVGTTANVSNVDNFREDLQSAVEVAINYIHEKVDYDTTLEEEAYKDTEWISKYVPVDGDSDKTLFNKATEFVKAVRYGNLLLSGNQKKEVYKTVGVYLREAKSALFEKIKAASPKLFEFYEHNQSVNALKLISNPFVSYDAFKEKLSSAVPAQSEMDMLIKSLESYEAAMANTDIVSKSKLCVINLTEFVPKTELDIRKAVDAGHTVKTDTPIDDAYKAGGGASKIALEDSRYQNLIKFDRNNIPYLVFDTTHSGLRDVIDFLKYMGYDKVSASNINDIDGVMYAPNSNRGFRIKVEKSALGKLNTKVKKEGRSTDGTENLDIKQTIINLANSNVIVTKDSIIDGGSLEFVLGDFMSSNAVLKRSISPIIQVDQTNIKQGKGGSATATFIPKWSFTSNSLVGDVTTTTGKHTVALFALTQMFKNLKDYVPKSDNDSRNGTTRTPIEIKNETRRNFLANFDIKFKNNKVVEFSMDPFQAATKFYSMLLTNEGANVVDMLPVSDSAIDKIKDGDFETVNIPGHAVAFVSEGESSFNENFSTNLRMNLGAADQSGDGLNLLKVILSLDKDGSEYCIKSDADRFSFEDTNIGFDLVQSHTVGQLIENIDKMLEADKSKPVNFYLWYTKNTLEGLVRLGEMVASNGYNKFSFLGDADIRNLIIERFNEGNTNYSKIVEEIRGLNRTDTSNSNHAALETNSKGEPVFNPSNSVIFKQFGDPAKIRGISSDSAESLRIRTSDDVFESLKNKITEDDLMELNENFVLRLNTIGNRSYKISAQEQVDAAVGALLLRCESKDENGAISYDITTDDLINLSEIELNRLIKVLGVKGDLKERIEKTHAALEKVMFGSLPEFVGEYKNIRAYVTRRGPNPSAASDSTNVLAIDPFYSPENKSQIYKDQEIITAHRLLRAAKKKGQKKIMSLETSVAGDSVIQRAWDSYIVHSDGVMLTNAGSRMTYDLTNNWQSGKFLFAIKSMMSLVRNVLDQNGMSKEKIGDEQVMKLSLDALIKTTGVQNSDGYEGTFFILSDNETNEISFKTGIRTTETRPDDIVDTLKTYMEIDADKTKTLHGVLILDKDEGVESGNIRAISMYGKNDEDGVPFETEAGKKFKHDISTQIFYKTSFERLKNESAQEFWNRQVPHARLITAVVDSMVTELNLPREMVSAFVNNAITMSQSVLNGDSPLKVEAVVNSILDDLIKSYAIVGIDSSDLKALVKKKQSIATRAINDVMMFGVSDANMPDSIKIAVNGRAFDIISMNGLEEASKAIKSFDNGDESIKYSGTPEGLIKSLILKSTSAAARSLYLKAIAGVDAGSMYKTPEYVISKYFDGYTEDGRSIPGWKDIRKGKFVGLDCEWIYDNDGNLILTQLSFTIFNGTNVAKNGFENNTETMTISFPTGLARNQENNDRFSDYRKAMMLKYQKDNPGADENKAKQYVDDMMYGPEDNALAKNGSTILATIKNGDKVTSFGYTGGKAEALNAVDQKIKEFIGEQKYFIGYNSKGKRSDYDVIKAAGLVETLKCITPTEKNGVVHLDAYNDLVTKVISLAKTADGKPLSQVDQSLATLSRDLLGENIKEIVNCDTGAHDAEYDTRVLVAVLFKLYGFDDKADNLQGFVGKNPAMVGSQEEITKNIVADLLKRCSLEVPAEDIDGLIRGAYEELKASFDGDELRENKFIQNIANYKGLSNESLRKVVDGLSSLRRAQDLKVFLKQTRDSLSKVLGSTKDIIDLFDRKAYDKTTKVLSYLFENVKQGFNTSKVLGKFYDALVEKYGRDGTNVDGEQTKFLSRKDSFEALVKLATSSDAEIQSFFNELSANKDVINAFSAETAFAEYSPAFYDVAKAAFDSLGEEYIEREIDNVDDNEFSYKIEGLLSLADSNGPMSEIVSNNGILSEANIFADFLYNTSQRLFYGDHIDKAISETMFVADGLRDALKEVMLKELKFGRIVRKATPAGIGTPLDKVFDIVNGETTVTSADIVISKESFEHLYGKPYKDVCEDYKIPGEEKSYIYTNVLRQPTSSSGSFVPVRLLVVDGKEELNGAMGMTKILAKHLNGDFDGDAPLLFFSNKEQSHLLKTARDGNLAAFRMLDKAMELSMEVESSQSGPFELAREAAYENKDFLVEAAAELFIKYKNVRDRKDSGFHEAYNKIRGAVKDELKLTDEQTDFVMNNYVMARVQDGTAKAESFVYYTKNRNILDHDDVKKISKAKETLDEMEDAVLNVRLANAYSNRYLPSTTGLAQRLIFEKQGHNFVISLVDNPSFRFKSIALDEEVEAGIRDVFRSEELKTKLLDALKKEFSEAFKIPEDASFGFQDFMDVVYTALAENNLKVGEELARPENKNKFSEAIKKDQAEMAIRSSAVSYYQQLEDELHLETKLSKDTSAVRDAIARSIVNTYVLDDSDAVQKERQTIPITTFYPVEERSNSDDSIKVLDYKGYEFTGALTIKFQNNLDIAPGYVFKKKSKIGGVTVPANSTVVASFKDGMLIRVSKDSFFAGTKLVGIHGGAKFTTMYDDGSRSKEESWLMKEIGKDEELKNFIKNDIIAYAKKPLEEDKQTQIDDMRPVSRDGKIIGWLVKREYSVTEDSGARKTDTTESYIDYYSINANLLSLPSLIQFGGTVVPTEYFLEEDPEKIRVNASTLYEIKNHANITRSKMSGAVDGRIAYQRAVIYTLVDLAIKNKIKGAEEFASAWRSKEASDPDIGPQIVFSLLSKFFNNNLTKVNATKEQKALLSHELFSKAFGFTKSGLDPKTGPMTLFSKSKQSPQVMANRGTSLSGRDFTTVNKEVEKAGLLKSPGYLPTIEWINEISNAGGRGIITDSTAIRRTQPVQRPKSEDPFTMHSGDSKAGVSGAVVSTVYSPDPNITKDVFSYDDGEIDSITMTAKAKRGNKYYNKEEELDSMNPNKSLRKKSSSKVGKVLAMAKFLHADDDAYGTLVDRANYINPDAKTSVSYRDSHTEYFPTYDNGVLTGVIPMTKLDVSKDAFTKAKISDFKDELTPYGLARGSYKNSVFAQTRSELGMNADYDSFAREHSDILSEVQARRAKAEASLPEILKKVNDELDAEIRSDGELVKYRIIGNKTYESTSTVTKDKLYALGMRPDDGATAEALNEIRRIEEILDTPGVIVEYENDIRDSKYNHSKAQARLLMTLGRANTTIDDLNNYMTMRGILERLVTDKNYTEAEAKSSLATTFNKSIDEAKAFVSEFDQSKPEVVSAAMLMVENLRAVCNSIQGRIPTALDTWQIILTMKATGQGSVEENKSRAKSAINNLFKSTRVNDFIGSYNATSENGMKDRIAKLTDGNPIDFIGNMSVLADNLYKTQAIIRMNSHNIKSNVEILDLLSGMLEESVEKKNGDLGERSRSKQRAFTLSEIARKLGVSIPLTDSAADDFNLAHKKVIEILTQSTAALGLDNKFANEADILACGSPETDFNVSRALLAKECLTLLYKDILVTSPKLRTAAVDAIIRGPLMSKGKNGSVLVDCYGRKIVPEYSNGRYTDRSIARPLNDFDLSYIRDAINSNLDSKEDFETTLLVRAMTGDIFLMDRVLADKLEEHVFTKKIPGRVFQAIQKSSRWCSKMLMSNPLKIARRFLQFNLWDFNSLMSTNPRMILEIPTAKKELSAFMQSKGAVRTPELEDYLKHQGFKYSDIAGYDPVTMESSGGKNSLADRLYFDKVSEVFSFQNLWMRYAFYRAELDSFNEETKSPVRYGSMTYKKDMMDEIKDPGVKAIMVLDSKIGGPGGFSELSKELGEKGMVFTTFHLAMARWAREGASTAKYVISNIDDYGFGNAVRTLGTPIAYMGASYGIMYAMIMAICDIFDVDEEDAKEMAAHQEFIDPINSLLSGGIVTVKDNSIWPLQSLIDSIDSLWEEDTLEEKVVGLLNENVISHLPPAIKSSFEALSGKELYGGKVIDNDYSLSDNVERKFLSYIIGASGANALVNTGSNASIADKIATALAAETGNSKAYKSDKKAYQKTLSRLNNLISSKYSNDPTIGSNYTEEELNEIYSLKKELEEAITSGKGYDVVTKIIADNQSRHGYTDAQVRSALRSFSVIGKLEYLRSVGLLDDFEQSLSEEDIDRLQKAIKFEEAYFPYIDDALEDTYDDEQEYTRYKYNNVGGRYYPSRYYTNSKRYSDLNWYTPAKNKDGIDMPNLKDLFIHRVTNTTGSKAIDITDLIGEYYDNYYEDNSGTIDGEYYSGRKNKKDGQSDWRN